MLTAAMAYNQQLFWNFCSNGTWQRVAHVMQAGAKIHWTDGDGNSALHYAIIQNNIDVAEHLVEEVQGMDRIDVNVRSHNGRTPLHVACSQGHLAAVVLLLERGAYVMAMDADMETPLHTASACGHQSVVERLVTRPDIEINAVNKTGMSPFFLACLMEHTQVAETLLKNGADVNLKDNEGTCPLHLLSVRGPLNFLDRVLQRNPEVNATDEVGITPLHYACKYNRVHTAKRLIDHGACVNSTSERGLTPLHVNACVDSVRLGRILLNAGANVDAADNDGNTALFKAGRCGLRGQLKVLFEHGVDLSLASKSMEDLCRRMRNGHIIIWEIVEMFIKHLDNRLTTQGFCNLLLSSFVSQAISVIEKLNIPQYIRQR